MRKILGAAGLAAVALALSACASSSSSSTPAASAPATSAPAAGASSPASAAPASNASGGALGMTTINGTAVVTNSKGMTLYWFVPDTSTASKCTGSCATYCRR